MGMTFVKRKSRRFSGIFLIVHKSVDIYIKISGPRPKNPLIPTVFRHGKWAVLLHAQEVV
jgi:hypothetical protein